MTHRLPNDIAQALGARPNEPLRAEDGEGNVYYIMAGANLQSLIDDNIRSELQRGMDSIKQDGLIEWDAAKFKREARERMANK